jgi:hypothetical protein
MSFLVLRLGLQMCMYENPLTAIVEAGTTGSKGWGFCATNRLWLAHACMACKDAPVLAKAETGVGRIQAPPYPSAGRYLGRKWCSNLSPSQHLHRPYCERACSALTSNCMSVRSHASTCQCRSSARPANPSASSVNGSERKSP